MNKFFSFAAAFMLSIAAFAEDYTLYYESAETSANTVLTPIANLQKLTFENGNIVLTFKDGSKSNTAISAVKRLFISTPEAMGINETKTETVDLTKKGVYDLTGRKLNVDVNGNLPKGIYIVDGKKIQVK